MAVSIEEALRSWLINDATIAPLIDATPGTNAGQVYKELIPETASIDAGQDWAAISYKVDEDTAERSLAGTTGHFTARVLLTLEAMTDAQLGALITAIRGTKPAPKLDAMTTQYLGVSPTRVWVNYVEVEDRPDDFVPSPHNADVKTSLSHMAVRIYYYAPS